jgi:hypothetical protein
MPIERAILLIRQSTFATIFSYRKSDRHTSQH